jgi:hypothetical protein
MAVGDYEVGGVTKTLIERSGGGIWTWMPTGPALNPSTTMNVLNGVSCVVSKFCEAVGFYIDANGLQKTLIERWSYSTGGAAWRRDASANPEPHDILNGVSCVRWPKPVCEAVGADLPVGPVWNTLVEKGPTPWAWVLSPNPPGTLYSTLNGVSCTSATFCEAVGGWVVNAAGLTHTLRETWNGLIWIKVFSANPSTLNNVLSGVSCLTVNHCAAAGADVPGVGKAKTLTEWPAGAWDPSANGVPNPPFKYDVLNGVSCVKLMCKAVGYARTQAAAGPISVTLVDRGP